MPGNHPSYERDKARECSKPQKLYLQRMKNTLSPAHSMIRRSAQPKADTITMTNGKNITGFQLPGQAFGLSEKGLPSLRQQHSYPDLLHVQPDIMQTLIAYHCKPDFLEMYLCFM